MAEMVQNIDDQETLKSETLKVVLPKIIGSVKSPEQVKAVVSTQPNDTKRYTVASLDRRLDLVDRSLTRSASEERVGIVSSTRGLELSCLLLIIWISTLVFATQYMQFWAISPAPAYRSLQFHSPRGRIHDRNAQSLVQFQVLENWDTVSLDLQIPSRDLFKTAEVEQS